MGSRGRSTGMREVGVGVALAIGLTLTTVIGLPTGTLALGSHRHAAPDIAGATHAGECPGVDDAGAGPAEIGSVVDVGGIMILLEEVEDASIGPKTLTASISGKDGDPLAGAMVYLTIRMPTMDHGVSAYPATELETGRYRAEDVSLGMGGEWVITVEVIRQARAPIAAAYLVAIGG